MKNDEADLDGANAGSGPVVEKLLRGDDVTHRVAWCARTGTTAVPLPLLDSISPPSLLLSYPDATHDASWTVSLPPSSVATGTREIISYLDFSPNGELLIVATSSRATSPEHSGVAEPYSPTTPVDGKALRIVIFQCQDNINQWLPMLDWESGKARPEGPRISKIVDMSWLEGGQSSHSARKVLGKRKIAEMEDDDSSSRKKDNTSSPALFGTMGCLAILDTQECLFFSRKPDQIPTITLLPLSSSSATAPTGDILFAGSAVPSTTVDALGNIVSVPSTSIPLASSMLQSARIVRQAAMSASHTEQSAGTVLEGSGGLVSKLLVACTSDAAPSFHRSPDSEASLIGLSSASGAMQIDPAAAPNILDSVQLDSMGNVQLTPVGSSTATTLFPAPSAATAPFADPSTTSSLGLLQSDGISGLLPPNASASNDTSFMSGLSLSMSYGDEIGMLDELFDFGGGTSDAAPGLTFNTATEPQASTNVAANDESKLSLASPAKSVGSYAGSSPQKMTGAGNEGESSAPRPIPEKLEGSQEVDEDVDTISLWQVTINWDTMNVAAQPIRRIPLRDNLDVADKTSSAAHTENEKVTTLTFLPCADRNLKSMRLHAGIASWGGESAWNASERIWTIQEQAFELSVAFATLEGRKSDSPATDALGREWVVIPEDTKATADAALLASFFVTLDGQHRWKLLYSPEKRTYELQHSDRPGMTIPIQCQDSLALVLSPSQTSALACAFASADDSEAVGRPSIFSTVSTFVTHGQQGLPSSDSKVKVDISGDLGRHAACSILLRCATGDVLNEVKKLPSESTSAVIRSTWNHLAESIQGIRLEQSPYLLPFLSFQSRALESRGQIARDLVQLAAMQRILQSSRVGLRPSAGQPAQQPASEVFDTSAIWPIIGHITWLFKLWDRIITQLVQSGEENDWSRTAFLIMHPLPRTLQQRIIRLIARFATFVMSPREPQAVYLYSGTEALDIEIARSVLNDLIVSNRSKTQEWGSMLQGLTTALGDNLKLPDSLKSKAKEAANGVREKLLPLLAQQVDAALVKGEAELDVVTKAVLPAGAQLRRCTSCSGRSAMVDTEKQGDWELSRRLTCICGGSWVAE